MIIKELKEHLDLDNIDEHTPIMIKINGDYTRNVDKIILTNIDGQQCLVLTDDFYEKKEDK